MIQKKDAIIKREGRQGKEGDPPPCLKNHQIALVVHKCIALPIYESEHFCKGYKRISGERCAFRGTENNLHECYNPKNLGGMIKI